VPDMHATPVFVMAIVTLVAVIGCGKPDLQGGKTPPPDTARSDAAPSAGPRVGNLKTGRVLFLGNSITLHGPLASVSWANNWGMAASAADKDYVHLLSDRISIAAGARPEVLIQNVSEFERHYDTYPVDAGMRKGLDFKADVVIVALGENVPALSTEESKVRQAMSALLAALKKSSNPAIFVRSSFWPDQAKDEILKQACEEAGGIFIDISSLSKDESNYARSERTFEHAGVAAHPGDNGMKAIAEALWKAILERASRNTPG
jgi:hypothetical protein